MPIEKQCGCCGGKILLPDPPANTPEQNAEFARRWNERVVTRVEHADRPAPGQGSGRRARRRLRNEVK